MSDTARKQCLILLTVRLCLEYSLHKYKIIVKQEYFKGIIYQVVTWSNPICGGQAWEM